MTATGFITGLAAESRVLQRAAARQKSLSREPTIACAGADSARAERLAGELLAGGAERLISFGIAGGLDPALPAGSLVLASAVRCPDGQMIDTDAALRDQLAAVAWELGLSPLCGSLAGSDTVVAAPRAKTGMFESTSAQAVDMESHGVAAAAAAAGAPFAVVRAVADPALSRLPSAVLGSTTPEGEARAGLVTARLCLRPWQLAAVLRLRGDARTALRTLGRLMTAAWPGLFGRP